MKKRILSLILGITLVLNNDVAMAKNVASSGTESSSRVEGLLCEDSISTVYMESIPVTNVRAAKKNGLSTPRIGKWNKTYDSAKDPNAIADGVTYTIKWKKVKGASGYEVNMSVIESPEEKWGDRVEVTKKCKASTSFSCGHAVRAKVRAYKLVNGKKVYGKWSKAVKQVVKW